MAVTISGAVGDPIEQAMWLAGTPEQRHRGLTGITDLGAARGMVFVFDRPASYRFYMWQTPMPLDILFFDASGAFVDRADMEPCLAGPVDRCERYSSTVPFLTAVEIPDGALDHVTIDRRSRLSVEPSATATTDTSDEP